MPADVNPETIQVAVYGGATIGALTAVILIVNWLKKLFAISGQGAVQLTAGVASYVAITIAAVAYVPEAAVLLSVIILAALLASGADAIVSQSKTANSDGIERLKEDGNGHDAKNLPAENDVDIEDVSSSKELPYRIV